MFFLKEISDFSFQLKSGGLAFEKAKIKKTLFFHRIQVLSIFTNEIRDFTCIRHIFDLF